MVWYSHLFRNCPQFVVIHTVKGYSIVNEAEVDAFLEFSCFYYDPMDVSSLISGSSAFSKSSLNIWKFLVHIQLKPGLENFEHYLASMWNEFNCVVVWTFFGIALLWDWSENWSFPVLWQWHLTPVLLPGKSHGQRILVGCSLWGRKESDTTERPHFHFPLSCIGEGNGNPLQCSCLENPRDGRAWWAVIYGVAESRTQLRWLSSSSRPLLSFPQGTGM